MFLRRILFLGLLVFLPLSFGRAQANPFPVLADPDVLRERASAVNLQDYPDADYVYLFSGEHTEYNPDGTSRSSMETWIKILTEKGRRQQASVSFAYDEFYGSIEIRRAEIHRADGSIVSLDSDALSRVMIASDQMSANIFNPRRKMLRMGIPGIEPGDTVRIQSIRRLNKTRMPNTWSDYTLFEMPAPLLHGVYEVKAPAECPLIHRVLKGEIPGSVTYESTPGKAGAILHRWTAHDVPRLFEEPAMPDWWTVAQRLLVSTIPDWETVSRWYWNLSRPHLEATTPAMAEKAQELTEGLANRQDRIKAVFYFVSQQIRYMGLTTEKEAPGYEPHDVQITFDHRYGVCRDKAALLVALLRLADIDAYPVLIHAGPRKDDEVPQPFFNHAIAAIREPDGTFQLLDPTDETTPELLPAYLGDCSYLVATPSGESLRTTPVRPAEQNMLQIETQAALSPAGDLEGNTRLRFKGINDQAYRGYFASLKRLERRHFFEGLMKRVVPGARMNSFQLQPENMQNMSIPIEATFSFFVPEYAVHQKERLLLPLPWFGDSIGMAPRLLRHTGLRERRFPMRTDYACGVKEHIIFSLPEALTEKEAVFPAPRILKRETLDWNQSILPTNQGMEACSVFRLHAPEFDPSEYLELKTILGEIEFTRRQWPFFYTESFPAETAYSNADVSYAFRITEIERESESVWTETRRLRKTVQTYAGLKNHSELILPFNPAWDEIDLVDARVTQTDGTVLEVRPEEVNIMDAAWVASAPRYPAERNLVINFPGVQVGSTIDVTTRHRHRCRPFFHFRESFGGMEPTGRVQISLKTPDKPIPKSQVRGAGEGLVYEETPISPGRVRLTWSHTAPPRGVPEANLPPRWALFPSLFLSSGNWESYAETVYEALSQAAHPAPVTRRMANDLVAAFDKPTEKVRALRNFVARHIRTAGPPFTRLPLQALTPADQTLRDGYGNKADQAILLYALLEAAGFKPDFVLSSTWPFDSDLVLPLMDVPQRDLFPSVLVRLELAGKRFILNDTDQYAELGVTSHDGDLSLDIPSGASGSIHALPGYNGHTRVDYDIQVGPQGKADIKIVRSYEGTAHAAARRTFEEMTPEDRRRYHQKIVSQVSQRAQPTEPLVTDFSGHPGNERFSVSIDRFAVREGPYLYLHLPALTAIVSVRADERTQPIWRTSRSSQTLSLRIEPPAGVRALLVPPEQTWTSPNNVIAVRRVTRTAPDHEEQNKTIWFVETHLERNPGLIEASFYCQMLEAQRRLDHAQNRILLFEFPESTRPFGRTPCVAGPEGPAKESRNP